MSELRVFTIEAESDIEALRLARKRVRRRLPHESVTMVREGVYRVRLSDGGTEPAKPKRQP